MNEHEQFEERYTYFLECEWRFFPWEKPDEEQSVYPHEKIIGQVQRVLAL